jgi:2-keto-4-pentenoate hydratase
VNAQDFQQAQDALVAARREAHPIRAMPAAWAPADLGEAYRLQSAVIDAFGPVGAWKIAAVTPEQRRTLGVATPIASAIPAALVHQALAQPAQVRLDAFIAPLIECELAFELARDLPARGDAGYTREEVAGAVASLRIAIELVDPRLPRGSGALAEVADGFNNGALIVGTRYPDWRALDLAAIGIVLFAIDASGRPGDELARGSGRAILDGDPFGTVVMLANAQPAGRGLRRGDIVTTGSCTGAPRLPGAGRYRAEFSGLGSVELKVDA